MDDNKKLGDTNQDDSFNEDFDFGENEPEPRVLSGGEKKGPHKNVLIGIFAVVVATVGILGYKYYGSSNNANKQADAQRETAQKELAQKETAQTKASVTTPPILAKEASPSPPPSPVSSTAPETKVNPATPSTTPSGQEQNFGDLAQAFSSADQTPQSPPAPPPIPSTTAKEGTIQELQKELFAPERPAVAPPAATAQTPAPALTQTMPPGAQTSTTVANAAKKAETSTTAQSTVPSSEVVQLVDNLHKLNQQIDFISNKIKHLDSYTHEISDNLTKLNETINALDTRVVALTNTTTTLSKDVGSVKNEVGHFKEVLRNEDTLDLSPSSVAPHKRRASTMDGKISIEEPEYLVHAVIPGRAWLKSSKGQILTVTEGDTVGNYGKILVIDAANGVVLTSSGVTFR
jgi:hypothetical protein